MSSLSDLEGEVDHSFFDSDCDDSTTSKDGGKKLDKGLKAEKENLPVPEKLHARRSQNTEALVGGRSPRTNGTKSHLKQVEKNNTSEAKRKEDDYGSDEGEINRTYTISSTARTSDKVISNGDKEEVSRLHSKSVNEGREMDDEDCYHQSQNESEEEGGFLSTHKYSGLKGRNVSAPKKLIRKCHTQSPSPPSTEADSDTDTDRSSGSSDESRSLEPRTFTRPKTSSSSRVRRTRMGSAGSADWPPTSTEESEDTVTDVTPLSTPDISPLQSLDLTEGPGATETEDRSPQEQQPESAPSSGLSNTPQEDEHFHHNVDEYSLGSESEVGGELVFNSPGGRNRKNYSFSNDEVRRIDRENQRLLHELSRPSPRSKPGSVMAGKTYAANYSTPNRVCHSGLNRQRELQRIERENLAFLKKLESVKPTPGMRRSEQLADYQRQARYPGASSKKERSSSMIVPGKGFRLASAATVDFTTTPVPRSNRSKVPTGVHRPAWC
ncbi:cilia- and flagella-associated protein 97 [Diretmus argenteus]